MPPRPQQPADTTGLVIWHDSGSGGLSVRYHDRAGLSAYDGEALGVAGVLHDGGFARWYAPVPTVRVTADAVEATVQPLRDVTADDPSAILPIDFPLGPISVQADEIEHHLALVHRQARLSARDLGRMGRALRALERRPVATGSVP